MIGPKKPKPAPGAEARARKLVTKRDGSVCVRCHRTDPTFGVNFDHRKNRSQGGEWSASNGQLMCGSGVVGCHGFVTQNPHRALVEGYAVPGWADPSSWPARRWVPTNIGTLEQCWVLYSNDGSWERITDVRAVLLMEGAV